MSQYFDCADADSREQGMVAARQAVRRGQLVVLPTDTLYGIGADAFSPAAVGALLAAKGRGRDMPVPVLIGSPSTLDGLVMHRSEAVEKLIDAFWPGGLTIIMEHVTSLSWDLGDSRGTVAVRIPEHPVALDLLTAVGPMAVSSANRTGQQPAGTATQARDQLGDAVAVYLEAGPSTGPSVPSSIVDATGDAPVLRREGVVSVERLRAVLPDLLVQP